jgi:transposase, IS30 family
MATQKRLTPIDRERIMVLLSQGYKPSHIADQLARHRSVISREITRNCSPEASYSAYTAQRITDSSARKRHHGHQKLTKSPALWKLVHEKLNLQWSPQQIAGELKKRFPQDRSMQVSHETIYTYIYIHARGALKKQLVRELRQAKPKRGQAPATTAQKTRFVDMVSIHDRDPEIESRLIPGHWEGDLMMGSRNSSALGTLVERTTRFTLLVPLDFKDSDYVTVSFANKMNNFPEHLRKSMTYDQGSEMSSHGNITGLSKAKVYFCDPHSPWQRGTNENTNGLLRQYFPKGTDFRKVPDWLIQEIQDRLNERPRAILDFDTPKERITQLVALKT